MGELPVVWKPLLVTVATLWVAVVAALLVTAAAAPTAAPAAIALPEIVVGGRGAVCGLCHLHLYRVQDTMDVDVLDVGWGFFGGTFGSLDFICYRQEPKSSGLRTLGPDFLGFMCVCVCVSLWSSILTSLTHPTDYLV